MKAVKDIPNEVIEDEKTIKMYFDLIKKLKAGEISKESVDLSLNTPVLSLERIVENMEEINNTICKFLLIPKVPISQHLEYFLNKGKSFDDQKYERLFDISTSGAGSKDAKVGSKLLDYSVKEKLVGFLARNGSSQWSDEKISEFICSIQSSNNSS